MENELIHSNGNYDTAQICKNGHLTNDSAKTNPIRNQDHCAKCGAPTIMACPSCRTEIRGLYTEEQLIYEVVVFPVTTIPAFCYNCGDPFPWTDAALRAARELADELDNITDDERKTLKNSLDDLVRETPSTRVAETRFKKIMRKVGKEGYEGMRSLLTDIVSEAVRKTIFGL